LATSGVDEHDYAAMARNRHREEGLNMDLTRPSALIPGRPAGYTILEVCIASGIMFALITSLLSAWSASADFTFMVNENLKRMEAMDRIRSLCVSDFNQSAQFVQYDSTVMVASVNVSTNESVTLYPAILQGGREIRFTRLRSTVTAMASPERESLHTENFLGSNAQTLSQYALAPVSPCFIINPNAGLPGYWNMAPVWESDLSGLTFAQNATPSNLRLYRYILVPYTTTAPATLADTVTYAASAYPSYPTAGPTLVRGMLLRQYRNANSTTWQTLGFPLSDSVVFDPTNDETSTTLPCFVFASAFDGVTRTGTEVVADNEVRLKMSLAMEVQKTGTPVLFDLRLSFPFRRVDYGE
jgi:hypothetical protein